MTTPAAPNVTEKFPAAKGVRAKANDSAAAEGREAEEAMSPPEGGETETAPNAERRKATVRPLC